MTRYAAARDPGLVAKTLEISLTDKLPMSRAVFLVGKVARYSDHPERLGANSYAPSLFNSFSEPSRAAKLKAYAKTKLPSTATSAKGVAKAVDEVEFRAAFKARLTPQLTAWIDNRAEKK
jgi:hypothetical protein